MKIVLPKAKHTGDIADEIADHKLVVGISMVVICKETFLLQIYKLVISSQGLIKFINISANSFLISKL